MKTLQTQYNLIKEGKGDKAYFMKLARYNFPDLITPVLSFNDTVTVLKNRSILSEGIGGVVTKGKTPDWHAIFKENITEAAKAEEKETTKEVTDMATRGYDYKDTKNYDNVFGQEFLKGFYTEMQDEKNKDKDVDELKAIVAKNLAKDVNYYVKDGQFGVKGVGYTTEAPGLGAPKEAKGKHKASGYGDLKESVLRSQIYLLVKEVLAETLTPADEMAFSQAVDFAEDLYDKVGNVEDVLANLPQQFIQYKDELEQHLTQKYEGVDEVLKPEDEKEFNRITTFAEKLYDKTGSVSGALEALKQIDPKNYVRFKNEVKQHLTQKFEGVDEAKKPSAGLTKKEKSTISKKAHAGKDIGKKGKGFEKVAKAAEKQYGSKEAGERVAAAAMWKSQASKKK